LGEIIVGVARQVGYRRKPGDSVCANSRLSDL
jgi:hypothetical protein